MRFDKLHARLKGRLPGRKSSEFAHFFSMEYTSQPSNLLDGKNIERMHGFNPTPYYWSSAPNNSTPALSYADAVSSIAPIVAEEANRYGGEAPYWVPDWESFWPQHGQADAFDGYAPIDPAGPPFPTTATHVQRFADSMVNIRAALVANGRGSKKLGFYGVLPIDAWSTTMSTPGSEQFIRQTAAMQIAEYDDLIAAVDFITSTSYLLSNWDANYIAHLTNNYRAAKARAPNTPLYIWTCPQYTAGPGIGTFMNMTDWRMVLDLVHAEADGIILWGGAGFGSPPAFSTSAEWWVEYLDWKAGL